MGFTAGDAGAQQREQYYAQSPTALRHWDSRPPGEPERPNSKQSLRFEMTLEQAYPPEYWRVQCAFKDSMIH